MAGATGLEPSASCVTGRRTNEVNFDVGRRTKTRFQSRSCLCSPWRPKGRKHSLHRFLRLLIPFKFIIFTPAIRWILRAILHVGCGYHSALRPNSLQVVERFGVRNHARLNLAVWLRAFLLRFPPD